MYVHACNEEHLTPTTTTTTKKNGVNIDHKKITSNLMCELKDSIQIY
jgi:hypothetical protein